MEKHTHHKADENEPENGGKVTEHCLGLPRGRNTMSVSGHHQTFDGHLNEKWPLMGVGWAANRKLRPLLCDVITLDILQISSN